jgi:hypothetical protein
MPAHVGKPLDQIVTIAHHDSQREQQHVTTKRLPQTSFSETADFRAFRQTSQTFDLLRDGEG